MNNNCNYTILRELVEGDFPTIADWNKVQKYRLKNHPAPVLAQYSCDGCNSTHEFRWIVPYRPVSIKCVACDESTKMVPIRSKYNAFVIPKE